MQIKNNTNIKSKQKMYADKKWGENIISDKQIRQSASGTVIINNIKILLRQSVIKQNKCWGVKKIDQISWIVKVSGQEKPHC